MGPKQAELRSAPVTREQKIKDFFLNLIYGEKGTAQNYADIGKNLEKYVRPTGLMAASDTLDAADEHDRFLEANDIESSGVGRAADYATEAALAGILGPMGAANLAKMGIRTSGWGSIAELRNAMDRLSGGAHPRSVWEKLGWGTHLPEGPNSFPDYVGAYTMLDPKGLNIKPSAFTLSRGPDGDTLSAGGTFKDVFDYPELFAAYNQDGLIGSASKYKTPIEDLKLGSARIKPAESGVESVYASGLTSIQEPHMPRARSARGRTGQRPEMVYPDPEIDHVTIATPGDPAAVNLTDPRDPTVLAMRSTLGHEAGTHIPAAYEGHLPTGASPQAGTRDWQVRPQYEWSPRALQDYSAAVDRANSEGFSKDDVFPDFIKYGLRRDNDRFFSPELRNLIDTADDSAIEAAYQNNAGEKLPRLWQSLLEKDLPPQALWEADPWDLTSVGAGYDLRATGYAPDDWSVQQRIDKLRHTLPWKR